MTELTPDAAARFADIALGHVTREYPHKLDHVLTRDADALPPRALHPIFHGSFDWHSCVHGYWTLARVLGLYPDLPRRGAIEDLFDAMLVPDRVRGELDYLARPYTGGFERPYGWAWLIKLQTALDALAQPRWAEALRPLTLAFCDRLDTYLGRSDYPIRSGVHSSTAFAMTLVSDHARARAPQLLTVMTAKALAWFGEDEDACAWEPSGDEFLSATLMEAVAMQALLEPDAFAAWFARFLPRLDEGQPQSLFAPARVADRSDGKTAHLDGLNLSRAWCFRRLARGRQNARPLVQAAEIHLAAALPYLAADYMGEHWLTSFALLALTAE
jgi:hypothetical protein